MSDLKECGNLEDIQTQKEENRNKCKSNISMWKKNIWRSYLFHFFMGIHLISGVLLPFFMTWGKMSFVEVMFLQSYFTMMILLLEIPCGAIADYISRKFSLTLGAIVTASAALIYGTYPNIIIFVFGETLWAFGAALISGTDQAFIYDTLRKCGKDHAISKVMAKKRSFTLLALAISAPIGSMVAAHISLNLVMSLMVIPFSIASMISLTFKEPNNKLAKKSRERYVTIVKSGFKEFKKNKILGILALEMIIPESLIFFLIWTYQLYLESLVYPLFLYGLVSAGMTIVQIIFNNLITTLENKYENKKRFLQVYSLIPGIAYLLMAVIHFIPISIPLILIVIGFGFSRGLIFANGINHQIRTQNRATVISMIHMIGSLIRALIYPFIGYLVMLNLNLTFIFLGVIVIVFAIFSRVRSEYL